MSKITNEEKEQFLKDFLLRKRAYKRFLKNTLKTWPKEKNVIEGVVERDHHFPTIISGAFLFANTPEGLDYWHKLSASFNKLCKKGDLYNETSNLFQ